MEIATSPGARRLLGLFFVLLVVFLYLPIAILAIFSFNRRFNNVDFPTRTTLGADLKLTERVTTFARQEFTYGSASRTDSIRVEVTAGTDITKFDENLVGSRVSVLGVLKEERIDAKYLNEWEAEVLKPEENHNVGIHSGAKGHEDQGKQDKLDQIKALRDELKASGKDHLSFFSIEAVKYTELK